MWRDALARDDAVARQRRHPNDREAVRYLRVSQARDRAAGAARAHGRLQGGGARPALLKQRRNQLTFYVLRFTFYVLRFTFYVLRFTFSAPLGLTIAHPPRMMVPLH